jgi:hypothetical protein
MDYETETINGHRAVVRHFFKPHEIQIGSRWCAASGSNHIVTIEDIIHYGSTDPWYKVVYSWGENGVKKTHEKDQFSFQCRYCLIIEDT